MNNAAIDICVNVFGNGISGSPGITLYLKFEKCQTASFCTPMRASIVAQLVKSLSAMWETWVRSLGWEDPRRRAWQPTPVFWPREFHGLPAIFIWFLKPVAYLE